MAETSLSRNPVSQKIASLRERQTTEPIKSVFSFINDDSSWMMSPSPDFASLDSQNSPEIMTRQDRR